MNPPTPHSAHITNDWSITLPSNDILVSYKINTGAQCNVIPVKRKR